MRYSEGIMTQLLIVRTILGVLAVGFAWLLGRNLLMVSRGAKPSAAVSWGLRTAAALAGTMWVSWRDRISLITIALALISAGAGAYMAARPKKDDEDLSSLIFPKE
jgi:predicted transporter